MPLCFHSLSVMKCHWSASELALRVFPQLVIATGAEGDRKLGVPGEVSRSTDSRLLRATAIGAPVLLRVDRTCCALAGAVWGGLC